MTVRRIPFSLHANVVLTEFSRVFDKKVKPLKRYYFLLIFLLCGVFLLLSSSHFHQPGLYYDEALDAALATDLISPGPPQVPSLYLPLSGLNFPLLTQRYAGSLKTYLLLPFFVLFGPGVVTLRAVMAGLGLANLLLTYRLARCFMDRFPAFFVLLLLTLDPNFVFETGIDWGPSALSYLLRVAGCLFLIEGWRKKRKAMITAAMGSFFLGIYNRATFHLFLVPFLAALLWFFREKMRVALRVGLLDRNHLYAFLILGTALTVCFLSQIPLEVMKNAWPGIWKIALFMEFLKGESLVKQIVGASGCEAGTASLWALLLVTLLLSWWRRSRSRRLQEQQCQELNFLSGYSLLTLVLLLVLPGVRYTHYFLHLYPFLHLMVGVLLQSLYEGAFSGTSRSGRPAFVLYIYLAVVLITAETGFLTIQKAARLFRVTGGAGSWSDAIFDVSHYLLQQSGKRIVCPRQGFDRNLFVLTGGKIRIRRLGRRNFKEDFQNLLRDPENLYLFQGHFPGFSRDDLFRWAEEAGFRLTPLKPFFERTGGIVYSVYAASPIREGPHPNHP